MANVTLKAKLVLRNDTESNWIKANPVLILSLIHILHGQAVSKNRRWHKGIHNAA